MPLYAYILFFSGVALEFVLAWRLLRERLWREYPFFAFYLAYVIVQSAFGFALLHYAPGVYLAWYSRTGIVHILLRFLLIWEVFRHTFPQTSPVRRMMSRQAFVQVFALIAVLTAMLSAVGVIWAMQTYGKSHSVYLAMERSFGFVQAVLVLGVLALARYYHLRVGRNLWGIAVAFGMFCTVSTVASALADLARTTFFPWWQFLGPLSFIAMLGVWTWAMWDYAPNPPETDGMLIDPATDFGRWSEDWGRAVSAVRKVSNP